MFSQPINSRANRFNGRIPFFNRFAGAERIGRGPKWRKGSKFDRGDTWRRPLDRNIFYRTLKDAALAVLPPEAQATLKPIAAIAAAMRPAPAAGKKRGFVSSFG